MTVSRPPVKFKRMYELISSCRWKLSVPSGRPSYVGSIERPYDLDVRPDRVPERMEAAMSASTWAPARQMTDDAADIRRPIAIPPGGRTTAAGRRGRGGVKARERFAAAPRPALRLVPPLADGADWTADTTATLEDGTAGDPAAEATRTERALAGPDSVVSPDAGMPVSPVVTPSISRQSVDTRAVIARLLVGPADSSARARSPHARSARAQSAHPPIRLTRRGRVVLAAVLLAFAAAMVVVLATNVQAASPSSPPRAVVVHPGDTLWSIAARVHPRGSLTETMLAIERLNHMPNGTVYVGEQLLVPNS
jgi:LysM domain